MQDKSTVGDGGWSTCRSGTVKPTGVAGLIIPVGMRHVILVVRDVDLRCQHDLLLIIAAEGPNGFFLGLGKGRQKHAGKNGNNRDHHQKFNQGES